MSWIVMCEVSGGSTGHRVAPLKYMGAVVHFPDEAAAKARADDLQRATRSPYQTARFRYWPQEASS